MEDSTLKRVQMWASIASSVLIPIVLATVGWLVQSEVSNQGTKKDYVEIAVNILTDSKSESDTKLREWAVQILDKHAPVPFSPELRDNLESGTVVIPRIYIPKPPEILMAPPPELMSLPDKEQVTNGDLLETVIENYGRYHLTVAQLKSLQEWLQAIQPEAPNASARGSTNALDTDPRE